MNAICDNTKFNRINNFQPLFWNNNEVLSWANILGSSVNVLIWSKRCVALYFACVCIVADMQLCVCVMCLCVLLHDIILTTPFLPWKEAFESQKVWVSTVYAALSLVNAQKDYKWKIHHTKYMWNTHKTLIQKYETRNSNAVSVSLSFQCICADVSLSLLLCKLL